MTEPQTTTRLMMVRPARFGFNPETATSNSWQTRVAGLADEEVQERAAAELDGFAAALRAAGVEVLVYDDTAAPHKPDSVFPNNWVSFHADGTVVLYPMLSPIRRAEVRDDLLDRVAADTGAGWPRRLDLRYLEAEDAFLEGTGSLVLDRVNRVAYACRSPRTSDAGLAAFAAAMGYEIVAFDGVDGSGASAYHTNVLMGIGEGFAAVCLESVPGDAERRALRARLEATGHEVIELTGAQRDGFAGNLLAARTPGGERLVLLSERAAKSLDERRLDALERHGRLVHAPLDTIEAYGGGSARCMLAEVYAPEPE
ncbi:MAG: arginine deiminase-related protein [Planctomycetota bacterium]